MRNVLITGSNSGFGLEMALLFASKGYQVVATMRDIQNQKEILERAKKEEITENHFIFLKMDVTDRHSIQQAKEVLEDEEINIDILINNAGYCQGGFVDEISLEDYENQFQTNVLGMISVTQTFLPHLKKSQNGKIINIGSVSGIVGLPGMTPYCASKFAVEGWSESLRMELLPYNIPVTLIQPASYQTKIWVKGLENIKESEDDFFKRNLFKQAKKSAKKGADPKEIANLAYRICQKKHPKLRYPIGKGARTISIAKKIIPWSWIETGTKQMLLKR